MLIPDVTVLRCELDIAVGHVVFVTCSWLMHIFVTACSSFQSSLLGSGSILGFLLCCPLFAYLAESYPLYKLAAVGVAFWYAFSVAKRCGDFVTCVD